MTSNHFFRYGDLHIDIYAFEFYFLVQIYRVSERAQKSESKIILINILVWSYNVIIDEINTFVESDIFNKYPYERERERKRDIEMA